MVLTASSIALGACSNEAKRNLGLQKDAPDEFSVVTRAPLEVPPEYALRPPRPGAQRPMELAPVEQARQTVFGTQATTYSEPVKADTKGAKALLQQAGAAEADPNIRTVLEAEREDLNTVNRPTAEKLMFWRDGDVIEGEPIDPKEEYERLKSEGVVIEKRNEEVPAP